MQTCADRKEPRGSSEKRKGDFLSCRFQESIHLVTNTASVVLAEFLFLESSRLEGHVVPFLTGSFRVSYAR